MPLKKIVRFSPQNESDLIVVRDTVRAIVIRDNQLLMVHSAVNGDYKFPGGGIEENETSEEALSREILEECGNHLIRIEKEIGTIIEYDKLKSNNDQLFKMISTYYICQVDNSPLQPMIEASNCPLGFFPLWIDIDKALRANRQILTSGPIEDPPWTERETFMLDFIKKNLMPSGT